MRVNASPTWKFPKKKSKIRWMKQKNLPGDISGTVILLLPFCNSSPFRRHWDRNLCGWLHDHDVVSHSRWLMCKTENLSRGACRLLPIKKYENIHHYVNGHTLYSLYGLRRWQHMCRSSARENVRPRKPQLFPQKLKCSNKILKALPLEEGASSWPWWKIYIFICFRTSLGAIVGVILTIICWVKLPFPGI